MFYFKGTKMLWFYEMQVQRMDTLPFKTLGTWMQLFVSVWQRLWKRHPAGTSAIHLNAAELTYKSHTK